MAYANNKISTIIESQLPAFVREDHHNFVQFVKSYYEFLEQVTPPVDVPLIVNNPDEAVYNQHKPYGNVPFIVGEVIEQYANDNDPTDLTATATVFAWNSTTTTKTVTVTTIGGSLGKFIRNKEIIGKTSGAIYWSSKNTTQAKPGAVQASYDVGNIRDLDRMIPQYLKFIKNEIASGFPVNFSDGVDSRTALKNLRDFYQSKGTENSFKLLFRLVFGEDIELYLPSEDMLRSSVGEIQQRTVIRLSRPTTDFITGEVRTEADLVGQVVTGEVSGATALVEKAQVITYAGASFVETDISDKVGTFQVGENIRVAYVDAVTNRPVTLLLTNYGVVDSINIIEGGSNYALGDRIEFTGGAGTGLLAEVTEVDSSGAIKNITIIDPGVKFTSAPTITIAGPHSGEIGYTRFNSGPLETLLDYNFTSVSSSNSFFSESDRRGAYANTGAVGFDIYETNGASVLNPAEVDANSYSNFVSIPGADEGLNAWWKFDTYNITDSVQINTLDGTFGDGNDPTANLDYQGYWGPRVGDSVFVSDSRIAAFGYGALDPLETHQHPSQNALTSNTYNTAGITGFKPVVLDSSGNGRHAWLQTRDVLAAASGFTGRANVFSKGAFSANGIYQLPEVATITTANSWVNGPNGVDDQKSLGGIVLRSHDDLRNANTQTWVMWYYPYGEIGYFGGTYNNDTEWVQYASTAAQFDANNAPNILSRDGGAYWALQANATSTSSSDYHDVIFRFQGATWDNGNAANGQIANTSGLYPGHISGTLNAGGGSLRAQTWNMIALSIDHTNLVGNIYFFNTTDGFHSSNGFSIPASQDANTTAAGGWPSLNGDIEGRAVVMGAASASANGDSNSVEQNPASSAHGRYAEVRYYDKALNAQQIVHLFKNPGGRFNKTLSGDWAIVNPTVSGNVASEVIYDSGESEYVIRLGSDDTATGLQLVYDEDFDFDPTAHYKMTVKAKNSGATYTANVQFGIVGIANTGTRLLGYDASDDWDFVQPIVQSGASLGTSWVTKTAVFGGNTSQSGWDATGDGEGTYDWTSPAKLYGEVGAIPTTGNTTFFRPVLRWDDWAADEATNISYVKIEAQRDATLTATLAGEFTWPRTSTGDAGKLSSSATNSWTPQYLSDNDFYQTYSYVIKSGLSLNHYFDIVTRLTHTSGKKLFGEVEYVSKVSASPSTSAFVDSVLRLLVEYYGGTESLMIGEGEPWDSRSLKGDVALKSDFGLYDMPDLPFDLDLAHGEFDIINYREGGDGGDDIDSRFDGIIASSGPTVIDVNNDDGTSWRIVNPTSSSFISHLGEDALEVTTGVYNNYIQTYYGNMDWSYQIDGSTYTRVQLVVERTAASASYSWFGRFYYGTTEFASNEYPYGPYFKDTGEPIWNAGEWTVIEWDMKDDPNWTNNTITELRFDLNRDAGTTWVIRSVAVIADDQYRYGSPDGPAWIAWDQSPDDNPYAKTHYSSRLMPNPTFATSNAATYPTKDTLIFEARGAHARLVTGYEDKNPVDGVDPLLALDGHYYASSDNNDGIYWQNNQGLPLDINSNTYRYVRMKVRRVGPGGYGTNDWLGACQGETTTVDTNRPGPRGASYDRPEVGGTNYGAVTIDQPSTLILPAGTDPKAKTPWHILEWDLHSINSHPSGYVSPTGRVIGANLFKNYNLGWLGITLTGNPTEDIERFEIDWIQVDDGTKYPRGNHVWPIARTDQVTTLQGARDQYSDGAGVGGHPNTLYVNDSWDYSTRAMGRSSVTVSTPQRSTINFANTAGNNATVIYVSKTRSTLSATTSFTIQVPTDDGCRVMRISANTANTTDWIVSDQLSANTDLDSYVLMSDMASTYQNWDVVSLELDKNDTIFVGHLYAEDTRSNPGTSFFATPSNRFSDDSRPFFVMHYQPTQNIAPSGVVGGNTGHNFYGVSNTYNSEIVFFGNTATTGAEILANGPRVFNVSPVATTGQFSSLEHFAGVDMIIDDRANLNMVGRDSDNMVMIKPAPGKSRDGTDSEQLPLILGIEPVVFDVPYNEGMGTVKIGPDRNQAIGVQEFEIANSTTLDSNNVALGTWAPHGIIQGPKGSFFVACNNYNTAFGTNSIYCYHVIASQNVATGVYSALNVYPVYANTSHTTDIFQGCTGMAIDSHDPPNFYYATSNTIFKIEPKGYSYEIGDTKITQLIPDTYDYWNTNFTNGATVPPLGWYPATHADPGTYNQQMEGTYGRIKVDARDRLFLRGRANVYLYDTSNNEITTAYSPQEYQADIVTTDVDATYENLVIADWDVEPDTGELVFVLMEMSTAKALVASVRPNANMSYTYADGGQLAQVLIDPAYTTNRYETPLPTLIGPGGGSPSGFKTWANAKIRIRKKKDSD